MKLLKIAVAAFFLAAFSLTCPTAVVAGPVLPVLIKVNVSNPAAVTFSATGAFSAAADSSTDTQDGASLLGFFTSAAPLSFVGISGTLSPSGTAKVYDTRYPAPLSVDFNLYRSTKSGAELADPQLFTLSDPAFSGTATAGLNSVAGLLPIPGASGYIVAGDGTPSGATIGRWVAVPEPSAFLYGGLVSTIAGCGCWTRRKFAGKK